MPILTTKKLLDTTELRRYAEARLSATTKRASPVVTPSPEVIQRLVHELEVHQIELEMQNEELLLAYENLEQTVQERTSELTKANQKLIHEIEERKKPRNLFMLPLARFSF